MTVSRFPELPSEQAIDVVSRATVGLSVAVAGFLREWSEVVEEA